MRALPKHGKHPDPPLPSLDDRRPVPEDRRDPDPVVCGCEGVVLGV